MYNRRLKRPCVLLRRETLCGNTTEELKWQDCCAFCQREDPRSKLHFSSSEFIIVKEKGTKERERERERERIFLYAIETKSNHRATAQDCFLHNSCRERKILLWFGMGVVLGAVGSFSFKLFSVRWRVLRNNPFIKVICETVSNKQRTSQAVQFVGFDVFPPSFLQRTCLRIVASLSSEPFNTIYRASSTRPSQSLFP